MSYLFSKNYVGLIVFLGASKSWLGFSYVGDSLGNNISSYTEDATWVRCVDFSRGGLGFLLSRELVVGIK